MSTCYKNRNLIYGFLREYEAQSQLFNLIPSAIYLLIFDYFPKIYDIYAIGKNSFEELGISQPITKYIKLNKFSSILSNRDDISNSYRTFILRDYHNKLSYFGHIRESEIFMKHNSCLKDFNDGIKIISNGIMAKISIICTKSLITIYNHDKFDKNQPIQYINYCENIFNKQKIKKICCLMQEAIYLTVNGQIYYGAYAKNDNQLGGIGKEISIHSAAIYNTVFGNSDQKQLKTIKTPVHVPVDDNINVFIIDIECGSWHVLLLSSSYRVYGYGKNIFGQLGFGEHTSMRNIIHPTIHPYLHKSLLFKRILCGALFSVIISFDGFVFLFGDNDEGQIGNGILKMDVKVPYLLTSDNDYLKDIKFNDGDCGNKHSVLITNTNDIYCFGDNTHKQCIPYSDKNQIIIPTKLLKSSIGISNDQIIERVIAGVDCTVFIICP